MTDTAEPLVTIVPPDTTPKWGERLLEITGLKTHFDTRDGIETLSSSTMDTTKCFNIL